MGLSLRRAGVLLVGGVAAMSTACGGSEEQPKGPPYAQSALQWALPSVGDSGQLVGLTRFTAAELNRTHHGSQWGPITYVDADVPSTRPDEVSVNPMDDFTWGAAAYSVRTHRCYVVVVVTDRENPQYGSTFYGELPEGARCIGRNATPETARSDSPLAE
jgi:hypothetical protein